MDTRRDGEAADGSTARVAFVLEQTLGHVTHSKNLTALLPEAARDLGIEPIFVPIPFELGAAGRIPGWSNWTVRAGVRARRALRPMDDVDALFVHTQVSAGLLGGWMSRVPTVLSLDATPLQYDQLGEAYAHEPRAQLVERAKHHHQRAVFRRARRFVTWSSWARADLAASYGVDADLVTVIPPGVDVEAWRPHPRSDDGPLQVLFVGGDLRRKGGDLLVEACAHLRADDTMPEFVLHLVTGSDVEPGPGVEVHRGLTPNSPELVARFEAADVFCLPTLGDCLPLVLAEAGAAGLPLISTDVGAISEIVRPGATGELVEPGDVDGLTAALRSLLTDAPRRAAMGERARALVEREHDAKRNAVRLLDVVGLVLGERRPS
ncbi:MAG: glycosyltransferase family 4 protein [Ilumatobacter sp.]|nr:glycosyltransferase family 4 protein [Ilumatobacter sp.]